MGRILDLFGEVAAEADEGTEGLVLSPDAWDRLRKEWRDEDIEDALGLVHESLLQSELVESAESLTGRLLEVLGAFGNADGVRGGGRGRGRADGRRAGADRAAGGPPGGDARRVPHGRRPDRARVRRAPATAC